MKINYIIIDNVRSFRDKTKIEFKSGLNILIGPNGGGKSNLLEILTQVLVEKFFIQYQLSSDQVNNNWYYRADAISGPTQLQEYNNYHTENRIKLSFSISQNDINSINKLINYKEISKNFYKVNPFSELQKYNIDEINIINKEFIYNIDRLLNITAQDTESQMIISYMNVYEICSLLCRIDNKLGIWNHPFMYFPANRANIDTFSTQVSDLVLITPNKQIDRRNLRSYTNESIRKLGEIHRYAETHPDRGYIEILRDDVNYQRLTSYMNILGLDWEITYPNELYKLNNRYELIIKKDGVSIHYNQMSSGEIEIISFILAMSQLQVGNGIVIIDEPELHLHPKYQSIYLEIIQKVIQDYNVQVIIATHSEKFITKDTLSSVIRVYKDEESVSRVNQWIDIPQEFRYRDMIQVINAQNNEKLFFADMVILVEGITDRIFFEKIIEIYQKNINDRKIIEVISTDSKSNFKKYSQVLQAMKLQYAIIGDNDYVIEQADIHKREDIKNTLVVDYSSMWNQIRAKGSKDGTKLLQSIKDAFINKDFNELKEIFSYIEQRHLKPSKQHDVVNRFIDELYKENIYILKAGSIEEYLPTGRIVRVGDVQSVIDFVNSDDFISYLLNNNEKMDEILDIFDYILSTKEQKIKDVLQSSTNKNNP